MGPGALDTAVLRVLAGPDQAVGLGFLVADGIALSCAHVVAAALDVHEQERSLLGATVLVDLPLSGQEVTGVTAVVEQYSPERDVVVLHLAQPLPGAAPVRLAEATELWGHPASAFGLPEVRPGGVWHSGVLRHRQGNGWVQLDLDGTGHRVSPGFSGGPVWDESLAGVVGMVVAAEATEPPVGYLIPVAGLLDAWPGLRGLVLPPSPFRGLAHFREADAAVFHGRRTDSAEIAAAVAASPRITLVGPSGCGKSSLALAGVLPLRRAAGDLPVVMRPGHHRDPLHALAAELLPLLEPGRSALEELDAIPRVAGMLAEEGLYGILPQLLRRHDAQRLLVVIDQFEELLEHPVEAFADMLFAEDSPAHLRVLCTLRADFLEPVLAHPRLGPAAGQRVHAVTSLNRAQLREIVTSAVEHTPGVRYEADLAERILAETREGPGALPLLSFTLDLLWARQERGLLSLAAYRELGGVTGALQEYADREWAAKVPPEEQAAADRLLTRLVRIPPDVPAATRRVTTRAELSQQEWHLAQRLAATRLLVLGGGDNAEVELAHEALITSWDRLARLIAADRSFLDWRETVRYEAKRWRESGQPSDLLPTETALAASARWLPERATELDQAERGYLACGRDQQQRLRRRRAFLRSATTAVVAVLVLLAGLVVSTWLRGEQQRAVADSRMLTQVSQDTAKLDPALSVMTALAAYQRAPTQEARNQLLRHYLAHSEAHRVFSGLPGKLETFAASRDGRVVLARSDLGRAVLFTQNAAGRLRSTHLPPAYVLYPMVSADGHRAAVINEDGTGTWFTVDPDAATPMGQLRALPALPGRVFIVPSHDNQASLSLDGRLLIVHTKEGLAWWDLEAGTVAGSTPAPPDLIMGLWLSADARSVYLQTSGAGVRTGLVAVELATGRVRTVVEPRERQYLTLSGDRTALLVCRSVNEQSNGMFLQPLTDGLPPDRPYISPTLSCGSLASDWTGERVVAGTDYLNMRQGQHISPVYTSPGLVRHAPGLLEAGGTLLLASRTDNRIVYTEVADHPTPLSVHDQELTHDGTQTISLLRNGSLQLRNSGPEDTRLLAEEPPPPAKPTLRRNNLILSADGTLVAYRESEQVLIVRESTTLRQVSRITTLPHPTKKPDPLRTLLFGDRDEEQLYNYAFDGAGKLITSAGVVVQQWDPRTGGELARYDTSPVLPSSPQRPAQVGVGIYPALNQVAVVVPGHPVVTVVEVTTGRVITTVETVPDMVSIQFDPSGRYYALLRQASVVELWNRDTRRRELGPLRSLAGSDGTPLWLAGFTNDTGRYLIAANNSVRFYQVGEQGPVDSYELGEPTGGGGNHPSHFIGRSRDGSTLIVANSSGRGGPLALDPALWQRELCRVIGNRSFTPEDQAALPAHVPDQPVCPGAR